MSHIFPLVSWIHTNTLTAGLPWTSVRDAGFRIFCCYARVQVCREIKKSSYFWRCRRCNPFLPVVRAAACGCPCMFPSLLQSKQITENGAWSLLCWLLLSYSPNARAPALLLCPQLASCPQVKEAAAPSTLLLSSSHLSPDSSKKISFEVPT